MRRGMVVVCLSIIFVIGGVVEVFAEETAQLNVEMRCGREWRDTNKEWNLPNENDKMCWAAAAANILDWTHWGIKSGFGTISTKTSIETSGKSWGNRGGLMRYGWQWWFNGMDNLPPWLTEVDLSLCSPYGCSPCGCGWATVSEDPDKKLQEDFFDYYRSYYWNWDSHDIMTVIQHFLDNCYGVTITIFKIYDYDLHEHVHTVKQYDEQKFQRYRQGHALTVWGYEPGDDDTVTLRITDSDTGTGLALEGETDNQKETTHYLTFERDGSKWITEDYIGDSFGDSDTWMLDGVQALKPPEPIESTIEPSVNATDAASIEDKASITSDIKQAIIGRKCVRIDESRNEYEEIPCQHGEIKIKEQGREEPFVIDPTASRAIIHFKSDVSKGYAPLTVTDIDFPKEDPSWNKRDRTSKVGNNE